MSKEVPHSLFLVRFASPVLRDGQPRPLPGTGHTFVARETTDDR